MFTVINTVLLNGNTVSVLLRLVIFFPVWFIFNQLKGTEDVTSSVVNQLATPSALEEAVSQF